MNITKKVQKITRANTGLKPIFIGFESHTLLKEHCATHNITMRALVEALIDEEVMQ